MESLPIGKLPMELLSHLLAQAPVQDSRVLLGPGVGLDCAVLNLGSTLLVLKTDPITFATADIGWYAVQVNANDIATTGAVPSWFLVTMLLPEGQTSTESVQQIMQPLSQACHEMGISLIGGHTEITYGLNRPILVGTMIGEVDRYHLITPRGAGPGDHILLTKGVPIEATAVLAREFADQLRPHLDESELAQARAFLYQPGISVLREASIAAQLGHVTAMHDPTEGGLIGALWELAEASGAGMVIDITAVPIPPLSARICQLLALNPLAAIASGALLLTVAANQADLICQALQTEGILCAEIGMVTNGPAAVWQQTNGRLEILPRPARDEIAKVYETNRGRTNNT